MPTEIIGILGVMGTILGSLLTFLLTSKRNDAEVDKLKAEAEKARAETEKIRHGLVSSPRATPRNAPTASPSGDITVLTAARAHLGQYYFDQANSAANIDMISLTLLSALENFGNGKFIQWIQAGKKLRILMLSPDSEVAILRSREESYDEDFLPTKILQQIKALEGLYGQAERQLRGQSYTGSLEIRLFDYLPYFSYFHTDKVMVMGLYYGHIRGLQSEALLIDEKSSIHAKMHGHFEDLWEKSRKRRTQRMILCTIAKGHNQFNHALVETLRHSLKQKDKPQDESI